MSDLLTTTDGEPKDGGLSQEQLKKAAEELNMPGEPEFIGIDDEFEFECQQCGSCCMHRSDIILNAFDIYNAAKYLGIDPTEFLKTYTDRILGAQSKIPMVVLKTDPDSGFCPFLKFDYIDDGKFKCTINPAKPGACRSHPIGLLSECNVEDMDSSAIKTSFIKVEQCPQSKTGKMQKVRDWMEYYLDHQDESLMAHKMTIMTTSVINWREFFLMTGVFAAGAQLHGKIDVRNDMMCQAFSMMASMLIQYGYANFEIDKDFEIQCEENRLFLSEKFKEIADDLIPAMREVFKGTCGVSTKDALEEADKTSLEDVITRLGALCKYQGVPLDNSEYNDMDDEYEGGEDSNGEFD